TIKDSISSDEHNQYQLLFQVNGNLKVIQNGDILSVFKNNAKIAELEIAGVKNFDNVKISVVREKEWPQIMGFQFPKNETVESLNTIVVEGINRKLNQDVEIETIIRFKELIFTGSCSFVHQDNMNDQCASTYISDDYGYT